MKDESKTKEQLIEEITKIRHRVADLEKSEAELKRMIIESQKPAQRYRIIFDSMGDAIHVIDRELRILFANRAFTEWLKAIPGRANIVGLTVFEAFPFLKETVRDEYEHVFKTGKPLVTEECSILDGRKIYTETRKIPIMEEDRVVQIITVIRDITKRKRAEEALWESEEKFRTIFDKASDGILIADSETKKFLQGNTAICSMLGYTKEEIENLTVNDIHPPKDIPLVLDEFKKQLKGEKNLAQNLPVLRKDGSIFYADISSTPVTFVGKDYLLGIFRDITERKRTEGELRKSETLNRTLVRHLPQRIFVKDLNSMYLFCNENYANDLGKTPEHIVGKDDFAFYPPELAEMYRADDHDVMTRRMPKNFQEKYLVQGQECWVHTVKVPYLDDSGMVIGILGIFEDITERKQAEDLYRTLAMHTQSAIIIIQEGRFRFVNHYVTTYTGYEESELIGIDPVSIIHPDDRESAVRNAIQMIKGERTSPYEYRNICKDGSNHWIMETVTPVVFEGKPSFLMNAMDITEQKWTQEELKKYREELETLVNERTKELKRKTHALEELNTALHVLLEKREEDKRHMEERFVSNIGSLVIPYVEKLRRCKLDSQQRLCLQIIEKHLDEIISPLLKNLRQFGLTPKEVQVASLIKDGKTTKEIAKIMGVGIHAINSHRNHIRKKIGLGTGRSNLQSHLQSFE